MICRKCSKKISGGFGPKGKTRLDKALREALDSGKGRRGTLGIIPIACLDICPKNAVTVALGSRPDRLYVVRAGTPIEEVIAMLGLRQGDGGGGVDSERDDGAQNDGSRNDDRQGETPPPTP